MVPFNEHPYFLPVPIFLKCWNHKFLWVTFLSSIGPSSYSTPPHHNAIDINQSVGIHQGRSPFLWQAGVLSLFNQEKQNVSICFVAISINTDSFLGQFPWESTWAMWKLNIYVMRADVYITLPVSSSLRLRNLFAYTHQCIIKEHVFPFPTGNTLAPSDRIPLLYSKYASPKTPIIWLI